MGHYERYLLKSCYKTTHLKQHIVAGAFRCSTSVKSDPRTHCAGYYTLHTAFAVDWDGPEQYETIRSFNARKHIT